MPKIVITVAIFFCLFLPAVSIASTYYQDVTIHESDNTGISFTVNFEDVDKYVTFMEKDSSLILAKNVVVGIPVGAELNISNITARDLKSLANYDNLTNFKTTSDLVRISKIEKVRGKKIATISVYPYADKSYYSSITIDLKFESSTKVNQDFNISPPDPVFDRMMEYIVLNYDQSRYWYDGQRDLAAKSLEQSPFEDAAEWFKIETGNTGLIKVTASNIRSAGTLPSNLSSDDLHLYYAGGLPLEVLNSRARPELKEIPIIVNDGGDGIFGSGDYFLFYGEAADRWRYPVDSTPYYVKNHYTNANCYWLAVEGSFASSGMRMSTIDGTPDDALATVVDRTERYVRVEEDSLLFSNTKSGEHDWFNWYWVAQNNINIYGYNPGYVAGEDAEISIRAVTPNVNSLDVNGFAATLLDEDDFIFKFATSDISRVHPPLSFNMDSVFAPAKALPHLDYCETKYVGYLEPISDEIDFYINSFDGTGEFWVENNFSNAPYVLDVSDPEVPSLITGAVEESGQVRFQADVSTSGSRYFLASQSKTYSPDNIESVTPSNLHNATTQVDLIVISPEQFKTTLEEYADYRSAVSGVSVGLYTVEEIMNEFAYGLYDPTAIRDFLKYTYNNYPDPKPSAVLLVGDGSFDFENHLQTGVKNYVPPYTFAYHDSSSSDENYVYFGDYGIIDSDTTYNPDLPDSDRGYDMIIARWPVRSNAEIRTIMDKIESYESSTNFGPWRATVTFVADDEISDRSSLESIHVRQTETLLKNHLPSQFYRKKVYLWEYPVDYKGDKPQVNDEIIKCINNGTLLINYVGHGNPDTWAHEHVFNRSSDLSQLNNADRLTLIFTASCSIGFFDDPLREGMAEDLIRLPGGGAVATVAATRLVYSSQNAAFNRNVFDVLFGSESISICQAMYIGKLLRQYGGGYVPYKKDNDRAYVFFGDPLLKLGIPKYEIRLTDYPDTLVALTKYDITGEVAEKNGGDRVDFDGWLDVTVYDSELNKVYKVYNSSGALNDSIGYAITGPRIYDGQAEISGGEFGFSFIAPLDIGYGGTGAKISAYGSSANFDALGQADSLVVDENITSSTDSDGPEILYTFSDRDNFVSGDNVDPSEALNLTISDESGINLTSGAGHGIGLIIDNQLENIVNLTDLFTYMAGSYTAGQINYEIDNLSPGNHTFEVKAWDNANNSTMIGFNANVVESGQMIMAELLNYPNPMHETTVFAFNLSSPARQVSLEIFTLSGKKIFSYSEQSVSAGYQEFYTWNGRDDDLDRVATGTYIYKATAISESTGDRVESFGKVVVIN